MKNPSKNDFKFWVAELLGGGFKYVLLSPLPGEMIQFD